MEKTVGNKTGSINGTRKIGPGKWKLEKEKLRRMYSGADSSEFYFVNFGIIF